MATDAKKFKFSFICDTDGELTHMDNVKATFKCPTCKSTLHWIEKERKLGAHGKTDKTVGHKIRVAEEL